MLHSVCVCVRVCMASQRYALNRVDEHDDIVESLFRERPITEYAVTRFGQLSASF